MNPAVLIASVYVFALAAFLGYQVISRVPPLLHTPLMSATNALSGISLIGSLVVAGAQHDMVSTLFGFVAVACSSTNVVGGFLITDRMLKMFRTERERSAQAGPLSSRARTAIVLPAILAVLLSLIFGLQTQTASAIRVDVMQLLKLFYILSAALFILGLKGLSS